MGIRAKWHAKISAYDIHHSLPLFDVVLRQAFQSVKASKPYRRLLVTQLFHGLRIKLCNTLLSRIVRPALLNDADTLILCGDV